MRNFSKGHVLALLAVAACVLRALGADGTVRLQHDGTNMFIQVQGDRDEDWHVQTSTDLRTWTHLPGLGPLLSGGNDAPRQSLGGQSAGQQFYRALKTEGLYDPTLLRTISLTFTQANWQTLLTSARTSGSNVYATMLVMDNGATNLGVGVRYKGNSSFMMAGQKKSLNIELDHTDAAGELMGYETVNLNNAAGDETIMREPLYFNIMRQYTVCPKAALVKLYINNAYWGVYSMAQQGDSDLISEWFPSKDGDRWRAPNIGGGGGGGGGGGFSGGGSALTYLGTNLTVYQRNYELKTNKSTNAWERLRHATDVLNNTPAAEFRDKVETVLDVDRWLWFLALENIFADDDSYFNKGADYMIYYEPESGRIHPIEHDGNEAFVAGDVLLSPFQGTTGTNRPVISKLLAVPELRQRYLAHIRTVLSENYNPTVMTGLINQYSVLSVADISADTRKGYSMSTYTNDLTALKRFVTNRFAYLTNHAEIRAVPPNIVAVHVPAPVPVAGQTPFITAQVVAEGTNGLDSVWLYHRGKSYGRFVAVQMFDDGAHGDGVAGDSIFGAATTNYPAGTKVRYYVEARLANSAKTASFAPARAENVTYSYRVGLASAATTRVVINEFQASNTSTIADPQGDYDDWIELRNVSDVEVDLTGCYLTDDPTNPRKWKFPDGTKIAADGYLLIWADEDGKAFPGLHANFKISADGEELYLIDSDAAFNAVLDSVVFGPQQTDRSYGRSADDSDVWSVMTPTPGAPNQ